MSEGRGLAPAPTPAPVAAVPAPGPASPANNLDRKGRRRTGPSRERRPLRSFGSSAGSAQWCSRRTWGPAVPARRPTSTRSLDPQDPLTTHLTPGSTCFRPRRSLRDDQCVRRPGAGSCRDVPPDSNWRGSSQVPLATENVVGPSPRRLPIDSSSTPRRPESPSTPRGRWSRVACPSRTRSRRG